MTENPEAIEKAWEFFKNPKSTRRIKPLGSTTAYAWAIEDVHGCNLKCAHCSCRLMDKGNYSYMTRETWVALWTVMNSVTPTCRADLCMGGEPSLHPNIVEFVSIAREICPKNQLQMTTNGTMLLQGKLDYAEMFDAGINIVYTDMYGPREKFIKLAEESGYPFYEYYNKPEEKVPSPWTYYGPDLKMIVLQENPSNWPESRKNAGLLGTWFNNLDFEAGKRFNMAPVVEPPRRRCNQPFIYIPVHWNGDYILCCQDNMGETAGQFGNVSEGVKGFMRYWYGERLQRIRRNLRNKNRAANPQCARCSITFSRCDYKHWTDEEVGRHWNGDNWVIDPEIDPDDKSWWNLSESAKKAFYSAEDLKEMGFEANQGKKKKVVEPENPEVVRDRNFIGEVLKKAEGAN